MKWNKKILGGEKLRQKVFILMLLIMMNTYFYPITIHAKVIEVNYQVDENYPPYTYTKQEYLYGFDLDLTNLIFNSPEYKLKYSSDTWPRVYTRLMNGEIDLAGVMGINEMRKKEVLFTDPVFKTYISLYSKANFRKTELRDLKMLTVGVGKGYYTEHVLKNELQVYNYINYENINDAVKALQEGEIDVLFDNQQVVDNVLVAEGLKGAIVPQITNIFPIEYAYGISKDRPELVQYMNDRIRQLKNTGIFEELYIKYFYTHSEGYIRNKQMKMALWMFLAMLSIVTFLLFIRIYILHLKSKLEINYREIKCTNEELTAAHEELQAQYEEI